MRAARIFLLASLVLAAAGALAVFWLWESGQVDIDTPRVPESEYLEIPKLTRRAPKVMRTVYLNREGARLVAGRNDARKNQSSIVKNRGIEVAEIPPFKGSYRQWKAIVDCVRDMFEPYDVRIVDRRPVNERYIMTVVGGTPDDLGGEMKHKHDHHVSGLAPFNSEPIEDAVVLVFSRTLRRRTRQVCETAAMEIAHAYGLDHAYNCKDVMSYLRPCARRRFRDEDTPCGEHEARACQDGSPTQNSHEALTEVLGLRPEAAAR
jgi:hypothetical protein